MKHITSLICIASVLLLASCVEEAPETSGLPDVKLEIADSGTLVFEMKGNLPSNMSGKITECGFYVSENSSLQDAEKFTSKLTGSSFAANVTLEGYDKTYYAAAFVSNGRSEVLSKLGTCKVRQLSEYVTFQETSVSGYDRQTETANLSIPAFEVKKGVNVSKYGVIYGTSTNLTQDGTTKILSVPSAGGSVSFDLTGLQIGTQYYICQYITDNGFTAYGKTEKLNFYAVPIVSIEDITDITSSKATVNGSVSDEGGAVIIEKGVVYAEGTDIPTLEDDKVQSFDTTQDIVVTLNSLKPNTQYTVRTYATNSEGTAYSTESKTFTTSVTLPKVTTKEATYLTSTSAVLNGILNSNGGETPSECGFYWSNTQFTDSLSATKVTATLSGATFSYKLDGLERVTTYYYRSYAKNTTGVSYGDIKSFSTTEELPTVTTASVTDITNSGAICGGTVTDDGGSSVIKRGVVWSTSTNPTISLSTKTEDGSGTGSFKSTISGLTRATKYYVRAYATSSMGTAYGEELAFVTPAANAKVTTLAATSVTASSGVMNASIEDDGGEAPSECGFYWSESVFTDPSSATKIEGVLSEESFSVELTDLKYMTSYFYQAYVINSAGVSYGELKSFSTTAAQPTVTTAPITDIGNDCATSGGIVTDDGGSLVTKRGVVWNTEPNPTVSLSSRTEDGSGKGSFISAVTGLSLGTTYYLRAYATNSLGTSYGEEISFKTPVILSTVVTEAAASITSASAVVNATMISNGGEAPSECGFYWSSTKFSEPSSAKKVTSSLSGASFSANLENLTRSTTYYYQAYSKNSAGISYGEIKSFITTAELPKVTTASISGITGSEAKGGGTVTDDGGATITNRGVVWSTSPNPTVSLSTKTEDGTGAGSFTSEIIGLTRTTNYYIRAYATNEIGTAYGEEKTFSTSTSKATVTTLPATSITLSSAILNATIEDDGGLNILESGFYWSDTPFSEPSEASKVISTISGDTFEAQLNNLAIATTYYYQAYAINSLGISYGEQLMLKILTTPTPMTPANCFIISKSGIYNFKTVKGNSTESVGEVTSCEVLWESFGTNVKPSIGDLISCTYYSDGLIIFETASTLREGNAIIAAKDAFGTILWSWHIWLTDEPQGQTYYRNAGVMMDRNLGATSATPGNVGALGLFYQWGRKDPFLGSSSISSNVVAESTITWPSPISSSSSTGTIDYAVKHPTTFITYNSNNYDWYYTSSESTDDTRWQSQKTIYDPCPAGWRVPDGGSNRVWAKAVGSSSYFSFNYNSTNEGMNFSGKFGSATTIWYPASGDLYGGDGALYDVGYNGNFWSVTPHGNYAYGLGLSNYGGVNPANHYSRSYGQSVRCLQE